MRAEKLEIYVAAIFGVPHKLGQGKYELFYRLLGSNCYLSNSIPGRGSVQSSLCSFWSFTAK